MNKLKFILVIFILLITGCAKHKVLISSKSDLIEHVHPTRDIIIYSQACGTTKDEALKLAKHNFSLLIATNISSQFKQEIVSNMDNFSATSQYTTIETSTYNNLIGAKYFNEPVFGSGKSSIYCTNIYYDFDYFESFEIHAKNDIILLKNIISSFTLIDYEDRLQEFRAKKNSLIYYLRFYYNWANKYNYEVKINLQEILELDLLAQKKIHELKDNELSILKTSFVNILENNAIVNNKNQKKEVVEQLLNIKSKAILIINQNLEFIQKYNFFQQYNKNKLNSLIKIKPVCKFSFNSEVFLQNMQYKIRNESYDIDGKKIRSKLSFDKGIELSEESKIWIFRAFDYGNKTFSLEITSDNGLKSFCKKTINIKEYDIRLSGFYLNMPISKFKTYVQSSYNGIKKEYPDSFLTSMLDSRKAYVFNDYCGLFVHNKLQCLIYKKIFNEKQLSCKYYAEQLELIDKGVR